MMHGQTKIKNKIIQYTGPPSFVIWQWIFDY